MSGVAVWRALSFPQDRPHTRINDDTVALHLAEQILLRVMLRVWGDACNKPKIFVHEAVFFLPR